MVILGLARPHGVAASRADVWALGDRLEVPSPAVVAGGEEWEDEVLRGLAHGAHRRRPKLPSLPSVSHVSW